MPKLIVCPYCKKRALYDETHAKQKENGQLLIWNCRYCKRQITHREEPTVSVPKAKIEIIKDIESTKEIKDRVLPLSTPTSSSHGMPPIASVPKLDTFIQPSTPTTMGTPEPTVKYPHKTLTREVETPLTRKAEFQSITREFPSKPAEFGITEGLTQDRASSYERRIKNILTELQKAREQTENLERRISLLTRRKSFIIGSGLLLISITSLIFAYISKDALLEGMSIVAFFFGVGLLLISSERYVKSDVATLVTMSPLLSLHAMLHQLHGRGPAVYLPPVQDEKIGKLFVPWESNVSVIFPSFEEVIQAKVFIPEKGVLLIPVGSQLLSLMEEELGADFIRGPLKTILETIKRTLTLKTGLAQKVEFNIRGPNHIELVLTGSAYSQICHGIDKEGDLCDLLGCPICSMVATVIAKTTGEPVTLEKINYNLATNTTNIAFHLRGWTKPLIRAVTRQQPSELEAPPQLTEEQEIPPHSPEGIPRPEKKDAWFDTQLEQGYCPICQVPLDTKTRDCPNCGLEL